MDKNETYEITVDPNPAGGGVVVSVDGEEQVADGFRFAAPLGTGLQVRKVVLVELVPTETDTRTRGNRGW